MLRSAAMALLLAFPLLGCQEDLEAISQVTKFRVLAVQTEPPEVNPGGSVALRVLVADPDPDPAAPRFGPPRRRITGVGVAVSGLVTPASAGSDEPDLVWPPFIGTAGADGVIDLAVIGVPQEAGDLLTADDPEITVTAIMLLCAGGGDGVETGLLQALMTAGEEAGLDEPGDLVEACRVAGADEGIVAFKTFRISDRPPGHANRNDNPEVRQVVFDGDRPLGIAGNEVFQCTGADGCREDVDLDAHLTPESFQTYEKTVFGEIETVDERLYVSWFTTGGGFARDRTGNDGTPDEPFQNTWFPPREGGRFNLWVVARDVRGGVGWARYEIEARAP